MAVKESNLDLQSTLHQLIIQYLKEKGFVQTVDVFVEEGANLGMPFSTTATDVDENRKVAEYKEELLRLFDNGNVEFFQKLEDTIPDVRRQTSREFLKLEFSLHLHFTVFMIRNGLDPNHEQLEESTQRFKYYLENRGSILSQESEYLPYFALPYIPNPSQHSAFTELFKDSWVTDVRQELDTYLSAELEKAFRDQQPSRPDLLEILSAYHPKTHCQHVTELQKQFKTERLQLVKIQENYQKLMHITTELLTALELSVKGEEVNLSDVMDVCLQAFPELFQSYAMNASSDNRVNPNSRKDHHSNLLLRSKTHELLLISLDYKKLKRDLQSGAPRLKMFILQALRWRLTRCRPGEQRRTVIVAYISNDLLGVRGGDYGDAVTSLITSHTVELRQTMARLLNAFASLTPGRAYLASAGHLLTAIMDNVELTKLEAISLDMNLATLQKLSLRHQLQTAMIEHNMIEWLLSLLEDEDSLSDYALEYAVALLMNLCLRTSGKLRCSRDPHAPLKVLINLLGSQNQEIFPYVNGALYSLLSVPNIKKEAQNMGLEEMLVYVMKESSVQMARQLEFVLKQLSADEPIEEVLSDYGDEDDDDEEQDVLEDELDKDDLVMVLPGELQGEHLLATHYSVHASASKFKFSPMEDVLMRPSTPRSIGSLTKRRPSSQGRPSQTNDNAVVLEDDTIMELHNASNVLPTSPRRRSTSDAGSPVLNVDHYASQVLNEVIGVDKPVTEAVSFPPILPREPEKFGSSSSVNEYVVAFSSRPKIPRTPEHSARKSHSPRTDYGSHSMPSRDG